MAAVGTRTSATHGIERGTGLWTRASNWAVHNWLLAAAIVAGLAARIVFWAVTDRRLDDALITIKFDKNLAAGHGLVHNLGDGHVHGFTSALSVLVPLPGQLIASGGGFFLIRLVSLGAFVLTAVYANRICRQFELGLWPTGFVLAFLAFDQNQVFYGMAGMETQIVVAVLFAGIYYVLVEDYTRSGIALGLAPLARPDFVLWAIPAYIFLLLRDRRRALRAAAISAAILLPWLIFTTAYYGSPVPNTVVAKSGAFSPTLPGFTHPHAWLTFLGDRVSDHRHDWRVFAPFLEKAFVVKAPLSYGLLKLISILVAALAVVGAAATWSRRAWRPAIVFLGLWWLYKLILLTIGFFEWYGVPAVALLILMAGIGLDRVARWTAAALRGRVPLGAASLAAVPALCLAAAYTLPLPLSIPLEARVQHKIEDRVRLPLGRYLGQVVKPGQSLTSESSGYVGWYTNGTLYDFPGLVSKTVVHKLDSIGAHSWANPGPVRTLRSPQLIAAVLHPDWLILRPHELTILQQLFPDTARLYRPVREFSVPEQDTQLKFGGLVLTNADRDFIVLRRSGS
jgi:hypothetical protein